MFFSRAVPSSILTVLRENASYDFVKADFIIDATWHDLDLSSILPVGTTQFSCRVNMDCDVATGLFILRKKGNTGDSDNHVGRQGETTVNNYEDFVDIGVDENRVCQYFLSNVAWTAVSMAITSYSIYNK